MPTPHTPPQIRANREVEPAIYNGMSRLSTGLGKRHNTSTFVGTSTRDNVHVPHDHNVPISTPLPGSHKAPNCIYFTTCGRQKDIQHGNTLRRVCQECTNKAAVLKTTGRTGRKLRATQKVAVTRSQVEEKGLQKKTIEKAKQMKKTTSEEDEESLVRMRALRK